MELDPGNAEFWSQDPGSDVATEVIAEFLPDILTLLADEYSKPQEQPLLERFRDLFSFHMVKRVDCRVVRANLHILGG